MIHHIIIKKSEAYLMPLVRDFFTHQFMVQEEADSFCNGTHWHTYVHTEWDETKIRRTLDKLRTEKKKGVSIRPNDGNHFYLCKGNGPFKLPNVIKNTLDFMTPEYIRDANMKYWQLKSEKIHNLEGDKQLEMKEVSILDKLIFIVESDDTIVTQEDITREYIKLVKANKKLLANYSLGRQYIRTASLYVKNPEENIKRTIAFYQNQI